MEVARAVSRLGIRPDMADDIRRDGVEGRVDAFGRAGGVEKPRADRDFLAGRDHREEVDVVDVARGLGNLGVAFVDGLALVVGLPKLGPAVAAAGEAPVVVGERGNAGADERHVGVERAAGDGLPAAEAFAVDDERLAVPLGERFGVLDGAEVAEDHPLEDVVADVGRAFLRELVDGVDVVAHFGVFGVRELVGEAELACRHGDGDVAVVPGLPGADAAGALEGDDNRQGFWRGVPGLGDEARRGVGADAVEREFRALDLAVLVLFSGNLDFR